MIKGRAAKNASFFILVTITALAITRVIARSRCLQTLPTSFVAYGKSSKGKVHQTWGVDKTRNMEHPGTSRNIAEHEKIKIFFYEKRNN